MNFRNPLAGSLSAVSTTRVCTVGEEGGRIVRWWSACLLVGASGRLGEGGGGRRRGRGEGCEHAVENSACPLPKSCLNMRGDTAHSGSTCIGLRARGGAGAWARASVTNLLLLLGLHLGRCCVSRAEQPLRHLGRVGSGLGLGLMLGLGLGLGGRSYYHDHDDHRHASTTTTTHPSATLASTEEIQGRCRGDEGEI